MNSGNATTSTMIDASIATAAAASTDAATATDSSIGARVDQKLVLLLLL